MDTRAVSLTLVVLLLVSPSASAAWAIKGAWEPDTRWDLDGRMRLEPDRDARTGIRHVYFNGFNGAGTMLTTSLNPNLATLGTSVQPAPFLPAAMFGLWKDCNGDGYVGLGDQGLLEYRAELLFDATYCPPTPPSSAPEWTVHNDGVWVVELVPIGYDDITTAEDENPLNLNDTTARVWADWGLPSDPAPSSCATAPAPRGAFRSTGGLIRYLDCFTANRGAGAITTAAETAGAPELGFGDAPPSRPDESASPLNQRNPWGAESDASLVRAFDCGEPSEIALSDPTDPGNGQGALAPVSDDEGVVARQNVYSPRPGADPAGTPAGTVNETQAGATDCDRGDADEAVDLDGRRAGSDGDLPYALEGPNEPVPEDAPRARTDFVFAFEEGRRDASAGGLLGARVRDDGGLGATSLTGLWASVGAPVAGRDAYVTRRDVGPERVTHVTYYAYVDPGLANDEGLVLPARNDVLSYAEDGCASGRVECDPAAWWRGGDGEDITPRDSRLGIDASNPTVPSADAATRIGVRVGQPYQMRDVDCIDTSATGLREAGVHWGALTQTACDRP